MLKTTLNLLTQAVACQSGMATLKESLKAGHDGDKEITLAHILKSNGIEHAIWAMRATTVDCKPQIVEFAIGCAMGCLEHFEKAYPDDKRPRLAIKAARDYTFGRITLVELQARARAGAAAAARAGAGAAYAAARAARAAAYAAAAEAAAYAAYAAARAAEAAAYAAYAAARAAAADVRDRQKKLFLKIIKRRAK